MNTARTYNQHHQARKYVEGKRRFSVYWAWSYPQEANRDVRELDNRFSTMTEVKRVAWPNYESEQFSENRFLQGIDGTLELFHLSLERFQRVVGEVSGHPVAVYQRVDQAGQMAPISFQILGDTDTMMIFGLDHMVSNQEASAEEIKALEEFLGQEGKCLILGPHHDVGSSDDLEVRNMEYHHHRDALVPRQQRFGTYTRSIIKGLGLPVENRWGLHPATETGTKQLAPLIIDKELDKRGWLEGVKTFNYHPHLPHYAITSDGPGEIHVLAKQPIDMSRPHPFTQQGNREINMFLWMPPHGKRKGDILFADSTIFTTLFGGNESLEIFWKNLATK